MSTCNFRCLQLNLLTVKCLRCIIHPYSIFTVINCNNSSCFRRITYKSNHVTSYNISCYRSRISKRSHYLLYRCRSWLILNILVFLNIHDELLHISGLAHLGIKGLHQFNNNFNITNDLFFG